MERVQLDISGLTSGHSQKSSYTLILSEKDGNTKLPIVIGAFEAQAIALYLENIKPQRPLTHDLFKSFANSFKIKVKEVFISELVEGIFYSRIICESDSEKVEIDARTSDAVALAIRFKCPIYTSREIMNSAGIELEEEAEEVPERSDEDLMMKIGSSEDFSSLDLDELQEMLDEAIQVEDYDRAARLRDEINKRS